MSLVPSLLSSLNIGSSASLGGNRPVSSSSSQNSLVAAPSANNSPPTRTSLSQQSTDAASRRSSTVDESGRYCSLPQPNGTPQILVTSCYYESQAKLVVRLQKASGLSHSCHEQSEGNGGIINKLPGLQQHSPINVYVIHHVFR